MVSKQSLWFYVFPMHVRIRRRKIKGTFQGLSNMRDMPHCSGFLDKLRVDHLLLTAESQGQLGLTLSNPLGHLETPTTQLTRISHTLLHMSWAHIKGHRGHFCLWLSLSLTYKRSLSPLLSTFYACVLGCWSCKCYRMKGLVWHRPVWPL